MRIESHQDQGVSIQNEIGSHALLIDNEPQAKPHAAE
jgi:hypothetical protein